MRIVPKNSHRAFLAAQHAVAVGQLAARQAQQRTVLTCPDGFGLECVTYGTGESQAKVCLCVKSDGRGGHIVAEPKKQTGIQAATAISAQPEAKPQRAIIKCPDGYTLKCNDGDEGELEPGTPLVCHCVKFGPDGRALDITNPTVQPGGPPPLPPKTCPPGYTPTGPGGGCVDSQGRPPLPPGWLRPRPATPTAPMTTVTRLANRAYRFLEGARQGTPAQAIRRCPPGQVLCPNGECADDIALCGLTIPPRPSMPAMSYRR